MTMTASYVQPNGCVDSPEESLGLEQSWVLPRRRAEDWVDYDLDVVLKMEREAVPELEALEWSFSHIREAVERSREILTWEDNWDGEGSPGFSEAAWLRAVGFLMDNAERLWRKYRTPIQAPEILPGPDGSIDIHWKTEHHELLVNIPANQSELASFYGDDSARHAIKGKLDTDSDSRWLLMWLAEPS